MVKQGDRKKSVRRERGKKKSTVLLVMISHVDGRNSWPLYKFLDPTHKSQTRMQLVSIGLKEGDIACRNDDAPNPTGEKIVGGGGMGGSS